ncbi:MAG TPA: DUF4197 domain-containing protein [Bacteroidales bacterium]|nr:DUF4197 domain-containing protein [Bacteroidales bacterium]
MRKLIVLLLVGIMVISSGFVGVGNLRRNSFNPQVNSEMVAKGLLEALKIGAKKSAEKASSVDGFYKNTEIFIPVPKDAQVVKTALEKAGMKKQITEFELSMNRAAEEACKSALPIMLDAIKGITFSDAMAILNGSKDAATVYLKDKTKPKLQEAFKPIVKEAISKVKVTMYWEKAMKSYNKINLIPSSKKINPDLEAYITSKAIDGLFKLIAKEEAQIRENPAARTTDLLKKIFK